MRPQPRPAPKPERTGEMEYFINCIELGQQPELVTADDAVLSIVVTEAEQKSLETGQTVSL